MATAIRVTRIMYTPIMPGLIMSSLTITGSRVVSGGYLQMEGHVRDPQLAGGGRGEQRALELVDGARRARRGAGPLQRARALLLRARARQLLRHRLLLALLLGLLGRLREMDSLGG